MYEIIWHGRGGQGVVVASQILAESAHIQGFHGVTSAPTFGPERRGAPLTASNRIADEAIRTFSQIEEADVAVVLDASLLSIVRVIDSLKAGGLVLVNTPCKPADVDIPGCRRIATVDATAIALRHHLIKEGAPLVNTVLLGAFAKATGLVDMEALEKAVRGKLGAALAATNILAMQAAFDEASLPVEARECAA